LPSIGNVTAFSVLVRQFPRRNSVVKRNVNRITVASAIVAVIALTGRAQPLPQDPKVQTGKLANGVSWMYRQHDNPPGKIALLVHVATGSLNESDAQRGLAHFIEHMAFNGSEHYAPGELIKYFEGIGMEFGADANAFTSFEQTSYMLFLPDTEEATIDKGVMTLSDYVFRAKFLPEEIEKERGIVMEEWRSGKDAMERVQEKEFEQVFAGSRFAVRIPIGLPDIIQKAPRDEFVGYYKAWYRPENITVIASGDAPAEKVKPILEKWFGEYKAEGAAKAGLGADFKVFTAPRAFVITDPELGSAQIELLNIEPGRPAATTEELYRRDLIEQVSAWIVNRRLEERVQKGEASYQNASAYVAQYFKDGVVAAAMAEGDPDKWQPMLDEVAVEIVRARLHGFSARELDLARKELLADAERSVNTESTRNAKSFVFQMNGAVTDGDTLLSAEQHLALQKKLLPTLTAEELSADFAKHFGAPNFAFVVVMPDKSGMKVPTSEEVLAAAKASLEKKPDPITEGAAAEGLLAAEPAPGKVAESDKDADLEIANAWLENGARVHHRAMDYKKDQVFCSVLLAGGKIEEKKGENGITELTAFALQSQPATGRLNSTQVRDLMTGRKVSVNVVATQDGLVLTASGSPSELDYGLQLIHGLLTDGKIEESAVKVWKQQQLQQLTFVQALPEFQAFDAVATFIGGGDQRVKPLLSKEQIESHETAKAQAWFDRLRKSAPIEVAVVGQIEADKAVPLVAKYVGSLPKRERIGIRFEELRKLARETGPYNKQIDVQTVSPKAAVMAGFLGCEASQVKDARALELASEVLTSRLIKRIREELAIVYSLQAGNAPSQAYHDAGLFVTQSSCDPANAPKVIEEAHKIYQEFADKGPSEEELANAKKQVANNLDEAMREPNYWFSVLRDLDYHGKKLEDEKGKKDFFQKLTAEEVVNVFKKYHLPAREFSVTAAPSAKVESSPPVAKPPAS
jgi:zinc protease